MALIVAAVGIGLGLLMGAIAIRLFYKQADRHHEERMDAYVTLANVLGAIQGISGTLIEAASTQATATHLHAESIRAVADSLQPLVTTLAAELQAHMDFIENNQRELQGQVQRATANSTTMRVP